MLTKYFLGREDINPNSLKNSASTILKFSLPKSHEKKNTILRKKFWISEYFASPKVPEHPLHLAQLNNKCFILTQKSIICYLYAKSQCVVLFKHIFLHFLREGVEGVEGWGTWMWIYMYFQFFVLSSCYNLSIRCLQFWCHLNICFPRTLLRELNIRDNFAIIVLTYKKKTKQTTKQNNCYNKSIRGQFSICTHWNAVFFNLAIRYVATCIWDIYLKCYIV